MYWNLSLGWLNFTINYTTKCLTKLIFMLKDYIISYFILDCDVCVHLPVGGTTALRVPCYEAAKVSPLSLFYISLYNIYCRLFFPNKSLTFLMWYVKGGWSVVQTSISSKVFSVGLRSSSVRRRKRKCLESISRLHEA